jgi:type II secretory pathway component PulJ
MEVALPTTGRSRTLLAVLVAVAIISIGAARIWVPRLKARTETPRSCILMRLMERGRYRVL